MPERPSSPITALRFLAIVQARLASGRLDLGPEWLADPLAMILIEAIQVSFSSAARSSWGQDYAGISQAH